MPAYVILLLDHITDQQELDTYGQLAAAARDGHNMTLLALNGRREILEGPPADRVVVLSFPTFDEAKAWYNSPAYQKALAHRLKGARSRVLIVEGLPAAPSS